MKKDPKLYAIHVIECIVKINEYIQGNKDLFFEDNKTYDAVIRNLQTLSEATSNISAEIKSKNPNIEWDNISGFRNIIVHNYLGDLEPRIIWEVIEKYLPELNKAIIEHYPDLRDL